MGNRNSRWMALGLGVGGGGGGGGVSPVFLLRDDFLTDEAAPLASPRAAEPGPGTFVVTDTTNALSIGGGNLVVNAGASATGGNPGMWSGSQFAIVPGAAAVVAFNQSAGWFRLGHDTNQAWGLGRSIRFRAPGGSLLMDPNDGSFVLGAETLPANQDIRAAMACITESGNLAYLYDDGSGWKLAWPGGGTGTTDVFFAIAVDNANATVTVSSVRWANLSGPWADDYGIATDRIAGGVGHWQPFAHEPDCLVEWVMAMVGGEDGYGDVYLRFTDENNALVVAVTLDGDVELYEVSGGNWNLLGSAAGVVSSEHRIVTVCDGEGIRVYSNNTLRVTAASSVNLTAAEGRPSVVQGEGPITNLIAWPRTLTGEAKAWLDAAIAD